MEMFRVEITNIVNDDDSQTFTVVQVTSFDGSGQFTVRALDVDDDVAAAAVNTLLTGA